MKELKQTRIIYLISGYINQNLTPDEKDELDKWRSTRPSNAQLFKDLLDTSNSNKAIADWNVEDTESSLLKLRAKRDNTTQKEKLWWPYAAAVAAFFAIGIYFYQHSIERQNIPTALVNDVAPGTSKAILRLSDGSIIQLDSTVSGAIAQQSGISIIKTEDGSLIYQVNNNEKAASGQYNTIEVPRGGKYQVRLPDGSKVWLNAASTLKYPVSFNEREERRVELSGEAYFNIAHNKSQPFVVKTTKQEVTVLGTEFNVSAYPDEMKTTTTLLKGSVRVKAGNLAMLKPGQQTILSDGNLLVQTADTEGTIGWKNGMFLFYRTDMRTIMRQLGRWYNIEVDMSTIPDNQFYGEISRDVKLSEVLTMLEAASNMKFKIEGRRLMLQK